jgi:hypothetical protein
MIIAMIQIAINMKALLLIGKKKKIVTDEYR